MILNSDGCFELSSIFWLVIIELVCPVEHSKESLFDVQVTGEMAKVQHTEILVALSVFSSN